MKKIIVILIFSCGLTCQCPCSHSEAQPIPACPGSPPVLLGRSLDLLWALWGQLRLWPGPTPACTCPQSPQPQLQEHSLSIQIFHSCRVYQADCRDLILCSCGCTERFPFLFFGTTSPGVHLWFWSRLCMWATLRRLFPHPGKRGQKQRLIRVHLLTQAVEREGYSSDNCDHICIFFSRFVLIIYLFIYLLGYSCFTMLC